MLFRSGDSIEIPLEGFQTSILEVYPLEEATEPLVAGVRYSAKKDRDGNYEATWYGFSTQMKVLNPGIASEMLVNGEKGVNLDELPQPRQMRPILRNFSMTTEPCKGGEKLNIALETDDSGQDVRLTVLMKPSAENLGEPLPELLFILDGKEVKPHLENNKGRWAWYSLPVTSGKHVLEMSPAGKTGNAAPWTGTVQGWLFGKSGEPENTLLFTPKDAFDMRPLPPLPCPEGIFQRIFPLGEKAYHVTP